MKLNFLQSIKSIGRPRFLTGLFLTGVLLGGTVLATRWISPVSSRPDPAPGVSTKEETSKNGEVEGISTDSPTSTPPPILIESKQIPSLTPTLTSNPTPTKQPTPVGILGTQPTIHYVPVPIYQSPSQTSTYNKDYWDEQIKQAEKEAEESRKARETYDQQCSELIAQRDAALTPIEAQLNETRNQLYSVEERVNERTRGQFVSETQRLRMIEAESAELQNKLNQLQNEYNSVYAQYGSC